jgi:dynactin 1
MDASLDDASPGAVLSDHDDELSPSARRAALSASTSGIGKRDHMSLASTGKRPAGAVEVGALQREVDELKATARVLEKQRDEDRDRLRQMEAVRQENEELASLKAKMLSEYGA